MQLQLPYFFANEGRIKNHKKIAQVKNTAARLGCHNLPAALIFYKIMKEHRS
jgi:hypothetical protein